MLLKVTLFLLHFSSLSLVWAQNSSAAINPTATNVGINPTATIAPTATAGVASTPMLMPSNLPEVNANLSTRFNSEQARVLRGRHFYCLDVSTGMVEPKFPVEPSGSNGIYWALFVQYPVLSYLDSRRKEKLLNIVAQLVQQGAPATLSTFNESNFCIGKVVHYGVGTYQESLLINFYFNGVVNTLTSSSGVSIEDFNTAFQAGLSAAVNTYTAADMAGQNTADLLVQRFLERNALAIDSVSPSSDSLLIEENVHPGAQTLLPTEDPTLRAIVLNSFIGSTTINDTMMEKAMFGINPNPINFGLEAGDIIFALFGSLCITAMMALVLLGFCIHPFFLA